MKIEKDIKNIEEDINDKKIVNFNFEDNKKLEYSKNLFQLATDKFQALKNEKTLELKSFLENISFIKEKSELALINLKNLMIKFESNSSERSFLFTIYNSYNDSFSIFLKEMNILISNENKFSKKTEDNQDLLINKLREIKKKENLFIKDFKNDKITEFKDLFFSYSNLIEEFYNAFFNHIEKTKNNDFINRKYFQLTEKIVIDTFSLEKINKTLTNKNNLFLLKFLNILKSILDDYYKSKDDEDILKIISNNLTDFSKLNKVSNFSKDLDKNIENIFSFKEFEITGFFEELGSLFKKDDEEKKSGSFLFCEIFRNLKRINVEIDMKNNYKEIILNQYYQFCFFLTHIKMVLKILFFCLYETNEIRIEKFHFD